MSKKRPPPPTGRPDSLAVAYEGVSFTERPRSNQPGKPERFFASSFTVDFFATTTTTTRSRSPPEELDHSATRDNNTIHMNSTSPTPLKQVVHRHVNGLCIVTAGETLPSGIQDITFQVDPAPACSNGQRRKQQAKMLKRGIAIHDDQSKGGRDANHNKTNHGMVTPTSVLAEVTLDNGATTIRLRACVWGTVLELNTDLTAQMLEQDPLLDGHLAIILPTGVFPPPPSKQIDEPTTTVTTP